MCGRYFIDDTDPVMIPIINEMKEAPLYNTFLKKQASPIVAPGEIFPTNVVPVIAPDRNGNRAVYPMKWGYRLKSGKTAEDVLPFVAGRVAFGKAE